MVTAALALHRTFQLVLKQEWLLVGLMRVGLLGSADGWPWMLKRCSHVKDFRTSAKTSACGTCHVQWTLGSKLHVLMFLTSLDSFDSHAMRGT